MNRTVSAGAEQELFRRLSKKDPEVLPLLYAMYHQRVYRYARKLLSDDTAAKDVMQETFLKAHENRESLVKARSVIAWLLTVARNEAFQVLRSRQRESVRAQEVEQSDPIDPHMTMESKESETIVQSALARLKPEYREVIVLREYEQLSYAEIAAVTGDSESSVKARIFKARKALIKTLKPFWGGPHE